MQQVATGVDSRFPNKIRIKIEENGIFDKLNDWIINLHESGITRWWNNKVKDGEIITPTMLRQYLNQGKLNQLGMTSPVVSTFSSIVTNEEKLRLATIRNDDKYYIQLKVDNDPGNFKDIDELSGGAQVSVLLSLVLETGDQIPLIIDQPEDEMDKAYMFDILLPALRRLKGKRQVIFATHDPNIVVNGDADNVIHLKASHNEGHISVQGAIEEMVVKDAIIDTLDGGEDAFELRQVKYGF